MRDELGMLREFGHRIRKLEVKNVLTPTGVALYTAQASANAQLDLTTLNQDIPGATLTLDKGTYVVIGTFDFFMDSGDAGSLVVGLLDVDGTEQTKACIAQILTEDMYIMQTQVWKISLTATVTVKLQARKSGGAGASFTTAGDETNICAIRTDNGITPGSVGPVFDTPAFTLGTSSAEGVANSWVRSDATLAVFDATAPSTISVGAAAVHGSTSFAADAGHIHATPATWAATAHNVLSATHGDSTAAVCTRGDVIVGIGASPKWTRYALVPPAAGTLNYFGVNNAETEPSWKSASSNPGAAAAILASDSAGRLQLEGLGIGTASADETIFATDTTITDFPAKGYGSYFGHNHNVGIAPGGDATLGNYYAYYSTAEVPVTNAQPMLSVAKHYSKLILAGSGAIDTVEGYYSDITNSASCAYVKGGWFRNDNRGPISGFYYGVQSDIDNWGTTIADARVGRFRLQNATSAYVNAGATATITIGRAVFANISNSGPVSAATITTGRVYDAAITNAAGGVLGTTAMYYAAAPTNAGTWTNHYGIYLADQTVAGTTANYAIYSAGGPVYFAGLVTAATALITGKIYPAADSTTAVQILKANGATAVVNVDTTNSRVGIGTTGPINKLHVIGTAVSNAFYDTGGGTAVFENTEARVAIIASDSGGSAGILSLVSAPASGNNKFWSIHHRGIDYSDRLDFQYGTAAGNGNILDTGTSLVTILTAGNFGIGTVSPGAKLDVRGSAIFNEDGSDVDFRIEGDTDANLFFVDASADEVFLGGSTNAVKIGKGGELTLIGTATVFDDVQFPIENGKVPASNAPNWEAFTTNTFEYAFSVDDYIDLQANELPHWWKQGTAGDVHAHITIKTAQNTGADRFAKFSVWVAYADANEVWVEQAVMTAELTIPTGSGALKAFYLDIGDATLTNYLIGAQVKVRIKRIAATGGTEYADDVFITQVGMHLEKDTMGSKTETAK